ncbi:MAG: DNA-processing protein DprA [Chloroflexota bacterium]
MTEMPGMVEPFRHTLHGGDAAYPRHLVTYLGKQAPEAVFVWGNLAQRPLASGPLLAFICSAQAPASVLLAVHDRAQQWRQGPQVIISGFHSPVEQEALTVLLRGPAAVICCPARGLFQHLKPEWRAALAAGRLTILSPFPDSIHRATRETAVYRNRFVAALADEVFVAYAHPGGHTEQLVQEITAWGKPLYTL